MKKYIVFIPIILMLSCSKGMVTFKIKDSVKTTVENVLPINIPFNIPIPTITTTATQEFENNKTTPELIHEVLLNKLKVSFDNSPDENFSMLKSIHIFIKKNDDSDKIEIAYLENIDSDSDNLNLICLNTNLVEYLRYESYKIDIEVTLKKIVAHNIALDIEMEYKVSADILG